MYGLGFTTPRIMLGQNYCHVSWCLESWHRRRQTARAPRIFAAAPWQTSNNTTWVDEAVCAWHRMRKKIHPSSASSLPRASPSEKVCLNLQAVQSKLWSTRFHPGSHLCGSIWLSYPRTKIPNGYPNGYPIYPWLTPMIIPHINGEIHGEPRPTIPSSLRWSNELRSPTGSSLGKSASKRIIGAAARQTGDGAVQEWLQCSKSHHTATGFNVTS